MAVTPDTYLLQFAHLLQGSVHSLLHDSQLLLLLFNDTAKFMFLFVQLVKQVVDLQLLGLFCKRISEYTNIST